MIVEGQCAVRVGVVVVAWVAMVVLIVGDCDFAFANVLGGCRLPSVWGVTVVLHEVGEEEQEEGEGCE